MGEGGEPASLRHGDHGAFGLLVGLGPPDGDPKPFGVPLEIGHVECHQLGAAGRERHAEGDQRAVAQRCQTAALDRPEQLHDHIGVGGRLAVGPAMAGAADAGQRVSDSRAARAAVRRHLAGPAVVMGDSREGAGDGWRRQATVGQERKVYGKQGRGAGRASAARSRHHSENRPQSAA